VLFRLFFTHFAINFSSSTLYYASFSHIRNAKQTDAATIAGLYSQKGVIVTTYTSPRIEPAGSTFCELKWSKGKQAVKDHGRVVWTKKEEHDAELITGGLCKPGKCKLCFKKR